MIVYDKHYIMACEREPQSLVKDMAFGLGLPVSRATWVRPYYVIGTINHKQSE